MSVKDVIKKSILESDSFNQAIDSGTIATILMNMAVAVLVGVAIYLIYKKFYNGVVYSRNYALTLIGMTVLTCMVTLAISTNIVISLGMVGAFLLSDIVLPLRSRLICCICSGLLLPVLQSVQVCIFL